MGKSEYVYELKYQKPEKSRKKRKPRNIIYFNPPFSKSVKTNVVKLFLNLIPTYLSTFRKDISYTNASIETRWKQLIALYLANYCYICTAILIKICRAFVCILVFFILPLTVQTAYTHLQTASNSLRLGMLLRWKLRNDWKKLVCQLLQIKKEE